MADTTDSKQSAIIQQLDIFGIPEIAARIYLHLIENPPLAIAEIAKHLGFARTTVYDNVEKLIELKLVERIQRYKSQRIRAYPIDSLSTLVEQQEGKTQALVDSFTLLKQSLTIPPNRSTLTEVRYYQGAQGLEQMIWNTLKARSDIFGYSTYGRREVVGARFYKRFVEEFSNKRIKDKVIINPLKETITYIKQYVLPKRTHQQSSPYDVIRYLPKSSIQISGDTMIYNDTFSVAYWQSGEVVGVEIDNPEFVKTQRSIFLTLWKQAKPIKELL